MYRDTLVLTHHRRCREFSEFLTSTFSGIHNTIDSALGGANTALTAAIDTVNRIPGVDIDPPNIDINLDFLNNVTLPHAFMDSLVRLNASLPTLEELESGMNEIVSTPFQLLRTEINGTLGNATVDRSLLPVPAKQTMVFCGVSVCNTRPMKEVG